MSFTTELVVIIDLIIVNLAVVDLVVAVELTAVNLVIIIDLMVILDQVIVLDQVLVVDLVTAIVNLVISADLVVVDLVAVNLEIVNLAIINLFDVDNQVYNNYWVDDNQVTAYINILVTKLFVILGLVICSLQAGQVSHPGMREVCSLSGLTLAGACPAWCSIPHLS